MKELPSQTPEFNPFEILRGTIPPEVWTHRESRIRDDRSIDWSQMALSPIDQQLFRIYGPVRPNHAITFHNSNDFLIDEGKHNLSVEIPTPQGVMDVKIEAEYQLEGGRDWNAYIKGFTAKFRIGTGEGEQRFDMTVPARSAVYERSKPGESHKAWAERQEARYQERLPDVEVLKGFWDIAGLIIDAAKEKYPVRRVGTPKHAEYE